MKSYPLDPKVLAKYKKWHKDINTHGYRPYLTVRSFNSVGTTTIISSNKLGRCCHLMSQGELRAFVFLESLPQVIDIREQFALDPRRTLILAKELGIRHPASTKLRSISPITTDLMVRIASPERSGWIAMAHKPTNILEIAEPTGRLRRAVNSLRLEEAYWKSLDVPWMLSINDLYDRCEIYNLLFVRPHRALSPDFKGYLQQFAEHFQRCWYGAPTTPLHVLLDETGRRLKLALSNARQLFNWLAWHRILPIDFHQPLELYLPLPRQREARA